MNRLALLFPGQGSQYVGMGKAVSARSRAAMRTFEEAGDALGWDVLRLCEEGDLALLTQTDNAQPAILTCSVAAYRAWIEQGGPEPAIGAGHSLGELSALACSGALGFADALQLVRRRGELMQAASRERPGGMAAVVGISDEQLLEALNKANETHSIVVIAGINSLTQNVVSGHPEALLRLQRIVAEQHRSTRFLPLPVSAAFHSPLMEEAAMRFRDRLENCTFHAPKWPVLSNVTGQPHDGGRASCIRLLASQLTEPVRWVACMEAIRSLGVRQAAEIGPGRVLTGLLRSFAPDIQVWSSDDEPDRTPAAPALTGSEQRSATAAESTESATSASRHDGMAMFLPRCLGIAAATRNGCTDLDAYRIGVLEPYREVEALAQELRRTGSMPTEAQLRQGWAMLLSQFDTKGTNPEERGLRLSRLLEETRTSHLFEVPERQAEGDVAQ
ncbi:ACP S-malonyltransferase [Paenibacillus methanolicus]|uniref:[acyl-carrier-protein] S-malonyltransferase n=1 Tax=Paenibacillus methanolicus TaxID=582686 RepID=A0A5S5CHQ0_9BACL|nr:ACP S-malonyltransferase [Paenibacillus methanolicus]TYP79316.1 [acyl-carrier-protein] S-malonyltransferase [Paenibacillus methanolicus]